MNALAEVLDLRKHLREISFLDGKLHALYRDGKDISPSEIVKIFSGNGRIRLNK